MVASRARRIPIIDNDDETDRAMVVSVITQYRILKFIAVNVHETQMLRKTLRELNVGTYDNLATAQMNTPCIEVIHMLVRKDISSVPILNDEGKPALLEMRCSRLIVNRGAVVNVFEAIDVIQLIKGGVYDDLTLSVGDALLRRPEDFPGIYTCSLQDRLGSIFDTIRKSRVHRFVVIDEMSHLKGMISLSDILEYILTEGEER